MKEDKYFIKVASEADNSLIAEWKSLWRVSQNANPFNSYEWFLACVKAGKVKDYRIFACYRDRELVLVLPLCVRKKFGIKTFSTLLNNFQVDTAFLAKKNNSELLKFFFSYIFETGNLYITKIDDKSANLIKQLFPKAFLTLMSANPCLELAEDPLRFVSKSNRKNIKKIINRNINQLSLKEVVSKSDLSKAMKIIFAIDGKSSKKRKSMDIFSKAENRVFFQSLVKHCGSFVRIYFLKYAGVSVAYQFAFLSKGIFAAYQTSFLYEYRKIDPGKTMLTLLLERLNNESVHVIDFGGGVSAYKQEFTPDVRYLFDLYYSTNVLMMFWWRAVNKARRLKQILLPKKYTRDHEFLFRTLN